VKIFCIFMCYMTCLAGISIWPTEEKHMISKSFHIPNVVPPKILLDSSVPCQITLWKPIRLLPIFIRNISNNHLRDDFGTGSHIMYELSTR
jgi:hypothetical protein